MDFSPETTRILLAIIDIAKSPEKLQEVLRSVQQAHEKEASALEALNAATRMRDEAIGKFRDAETMQKNVTNREANLVERENALSTRRVELDRTAEEVAAKKTAVEAAERDLTKAKSEFETRKNDIEAKIEATLVEAQTLKADYEEKLGALKKITHGG